MLKLPELKFTNKYRIYDSLSKQPKTSSFLKRYKEKPSGIYRIYDENLKLLYIGKSKNIIQRVYQHKVATKNTGNQEYKIKHHYYYYDYAILTDEVDREIYETYYINKLKPLFNRNKVFTYKINYDLSEYFLPEQKKYDEVYVKIMRKLCDKAMEQHMVLP